MELKWTWFFEPTIRFGLVIVHSKSNNLVAKKEISETEKDRKIMFKVVSSTSDIVANHSADIALRLAVDLKIQLILKTYFVATSLKWHWAVALETKPNFTDLIGDLNLTNWKNCCDLIFRWRSFSCLNCRQSSLAFFFHVKNERVVYTFDILT